MKPLVEISHLTLTLVLGQAGAARLRELRGTRIGMVVYVNAIKLAAICPYLTSATVFFDTINLSNFSALNACSITYSCLC